MKKYAFVTFLLLSSALFAQPDYQPQGFTSNNSAKAPSLNWVRSYSEAVSLSQSTSKPIVILFTGTAWCPACMRLERDVLKKPEFAQAVGQKFIFLKAEFPDYTESAVMASPYKPLIDRYGVNEYPTIVVVNANGQKLYTVSYHNGGARAYADELLQKLQTSSPSP